MLQLYARPLLPLTDLEHSEATHRRAVPSRTGGIPPASGESQFSPSMSIQPLPGGPFVNKARGVDAPKVRRRKTEERMVMAGFMLRLERKLRPNFGRC